MTRLSALTAATFLVAFFMGTAAYAQTPCAPTETVRKSLSERYSEVVVMRGLVDQRLFEIWSDGSGGFTVTMTHPNADMTCMIAAGHSLHEVEPKKPSEEPTS